MNKARALLQKHWGFSSFREPQEEIINTVLENQDVFVLLPTGAGKSLCYQLPALVNDGICLVISPLIALMEDQVKSLEEKGIKALALSSKLNRHEIIIAFDNLIHGNYKFLYISPEKLQSEFIQEKISQLHLNLIAIDEVHCISQWGHDFRPAYLKLPLLTELHPQTPKIVLTATATASVEKDIVENLQLHNAKVFKGSYYRNNLCIRIHKTENIRQGMVKLVKSIDEPSIIYVGSRKNAIYYAQMLQQNDIKATYYHGGLSHEEKSRSFQEWKSETVKVMVATNAFGMGIDKSNVRLIIHAHLPNSIENYIQEIGRAGRDDKKAWAYLLYNDNSFYESDSLIEKSIVSPLDCKLIFTKLNDYFQIAIGELNERLFDFDMQEFSSRYHFTYNKVYYALQHLHNENIIFLDQGFSKNSRIRVIDHSDNLYHMQKGNNDASKVLQVLLRSYGGIHDQFITINEKFIAQKLNKTKQDIIQVINRLEKDEVLIYKKASNHMTIKFLVPREDNFIYHSISNHIKNRNSSKLKKASALKDLLKNNLVCRQIQLLDYFSENLTKPCGQCDVCLTNQATLKLDQESLSKKIIDLLHQYKNLDINEISTYLMIEKKLIIKTLEILVEKKSIDLDLQNKFYLNK